jgi:hypothetical protein
MDSRGNTRADLETQFRRGVADACPQCGAPTEKDYTLTEHRRCLKCDVLWTVTPDGSLVEPPRTSTARHSMGGLELAQHEASCLGERGRTRAREILREISASLARIDALPTVAAFLSPIQIRVLYLRDLVDAEIR